MGSSRSARVACLVAGLGLALGSAVRAEALPLGGRVEDDKGKPIAGAAVRLYPLLGSARDAALHLDGAWPPPAVAEATADREGVYRLAAPSPGLYRLVASASGRAARERLLVGLVEETWLPPAVLPAAAPLEVRVDGPDGKPVAGALVLARPAAESFSRGGVTWSPLTARLRTDASGKAVVDRAAADRFDVVAAASGLGVGERKKVAGGTARLQLATGVRRALLATRRGGAVAPEVLVSTGDHGLPLGRTGAGGRLVVELGAGDPLPLRLDDADRSAARTTLVPLARGAAPAPQRVELEPPQRVDGRAIDLESRRPVVGGLVWVGADGTSSITDSRGSYSVEAVLPSGNTQLSAAAPGYFPARAAVAGSTPGPTLALERDGALAGSVVDRQGQPLEGVEVKVEPVFDRMGRGTSMRAMQRRAAQGSPRARTDPRGRFRVSGLDPRQRHGVAFRREGFAPHAEEVPPMPPGEGRDLLVTLVAGAGGRGIVVDAEGQPVPGANLTLRRNEGNATVFRFPGGDDGQRPDAEAVSDRSGAFTFDHLAAGRYQLEATATGFAATTMPGVEIPEGAAGAVDLGRVELVAGVPVSGRVIDERGQPIGEVEVFALGPLEARMPSLRFFPGEPATTTAPDGFFQLADRRPGERIDVAVRRTGYGEGRAAGVVVPSEEPVVITLREASDLRGRLIDERREPVADAQVHSMIERGGGGFQYRGTGGSATSGADGRFAIEDIEPGTVRLTVSADGYLPLDRGGIEVPPGRDLEGLELVLRSAAVVEGVVLAADGRPVAGADVRVVAEGQGGMRGFPSSASTDGDGRYRLATVEPGLRTLQATHEAHERAVGEIEVAPGANRLDLRLGAGHEVSGVVTGGGAPLAGATVAVGPQGQGRWGQRSASTDAAGAFRIEGVPDGIYEVVAEHRDHAPATETVTVAGGPVGGLSLDLPSGQAIVGNLRGLSAAELALARVSASGAETWRIGEVSHDGRYRISGLGPGEWSVNAGLSSGGRKATGRAVLAGERETTLDLDFTGGLSLSGTVRHEGRPVGGAMVFARATDVVSTGNATTDQHGQYRIENLSAGSYRVDVAEMQRGWRHSSELKLEEDRELDVDLRALRLSGRVRDALSDEPIAGAQVSLESADDDTRMGGRNAVESDDAGGFALVSLTEGRWRVVAQKTGFARGEITVEVGDESVDGIELRLQPTQGIALRVARSLGSPPSMVHVAVVDAAQRVVSASAYQTGEGGLVRISTVPPGAWEMLVAAEGSAVVRAPVSSPGPTVDVMLQPAAVLEVVVPALAEGETIASLTVRGPDGKAFVVPDWNGVRDELRIWRGRTTLHQMPGGTWTLEVTAPDGSRWTGTASTAPGASTTVELR